MGEVSPSNPLSVKNRWTEQAHPIAMFLDDEGSHPRFDDVGGHLSSKTAQNTVPEHRGGAHVLTLSFDFSGLCRDYAGIPEIFMPTRGQLITFPHSLQQYRGAIERIPYTH